MIFVPKWLHLYMFGALSQMLVPQIMQKIQMVSQYSQFSIWQHMLIVVYMLS
jgi:hypothetical protein